MTTLPTTRTGQGEIAHYTGGEVTKYQERAVSDATKRAYASDFRHFTAWCEEQTATSLPAEPTVVAAYLEHLADEGYSTWISLPGRWTTLVWRRHRFVCDNCDSRHLEDHPEFEGRLTRRLARRLVADARVMTLRAAALPAGAVRERAPDASRSAHPASGRVLNGDVRLVKEPLGSAVRS